MKILFAVSNRREAHMALRLTRGFDAAEITFLLLGELPDDVLDERASSVVRDVELCMMSAHSFNVLIMFTGEWTRRTPAHFAFIECFNEIGVPTIEVQSGIFQNEMWAEISPARRLVAWQGNNGVGYPAPESSTFGEPYFVDKFVLIAVGDDWRACDEEGRYVFGIAIAKLVQMRPETHFVWKLEEHDDYSHDLVEMVKGYQFDNLSFECERPLQDLISKADAVIATLSTALVDVQLSQKPALVFVSGLERRNGRSKDLSLQSFQRAPELLDRWQELVERPESFLVDMGVSRFAPDRFVEQILLAAAARSINPLRPKLALEFIALRRSLLGPELAHLSDEQPTLQADSQRLERTLPERTSLMRAGGDRIKPQGTNGSQQPEEPKVVRGRQSRIENAIANPRGLIARYMALRQKK